MACFLENNADYLRSFDATNRFLLEVCLGWTRIYSGHETYSADISAQTAAGLGGLSYRNFT